MNNILSLNRFDEKLLKKGWTLKRLAEEYDKKHGTEKGETIYNTLRNWHQGKGNPTLEKLIRICDLLECDVDYLLGRIKDSTHTIKFIREETGLSENAINVLKEWNRISKEKGAQYAWARNSLQALNDLLSQGVLLAHNVFSPIAEYMVYRFEYETKGKKANLDKYRLALFTASDGLSECIKNIYHAAHPKPKKRHPAQNTECLIITKKQGARN